MSHIASSPRRVALYVRVSTTRQAEGELSIPDQIKQGKDYCTARGLVLTETFIEPGASATDDRRPEFQRMMESATSAARPFDVVLVHSMSRFFREQFLSEMYIRKLHKAQVELISITQEFRDDPTGNLIRQILGSFDEYQSRENGKHTLRAMQENARQGFWNGSKPPFGYRVEDKEKRGSKTKKVLVIDEQEAPIVRRIYDLALGRRGVPQGVKAIVNDLNAAGCRHHGKPFHISSVHRILTSTTYAGTLHFNRREARSGREKPPEQWLMISVPSIVTQEEFDQVQAHLHARSPKRVPPRIVGSPTLLTGIARCGTCGSGMTLRTGKSGRYRYYACAGCGQKGKTLCPGRSIGMGTLDEAVLGHLTERLFTPERLEIILSAYLARSAEAGEARRAQLSQARRARTEAEGRLNRLLQLVEQGLMDISDPALKERMEVAKRDRQSAVETVRLLEAAEGNQPAAITLESLGRLADALRAALASDDPSFRKAYLRLFVDEVTVGDEQIVLSGPKSALARATAAGDLPAASATVPSFVRQWRPVGAP
jgi:DNA invertase Pin-like site-specific DNA recombinase